MKITLRTNKVLVLISILVSILLFAVTLTTYINYKSATSFLKLALLDDAEHEKMYINTLYQLGFTKDSIVNIINRNKIIKRSIGNSGEFSIGEVFGDSIRVLVRKKNNIKNLKSIIISKDMSFALPLRLALNNKQGVCKGLDYNGNEVFAGYTYFEPLKLGIVSKISFIEVIEPYYYSILLSILISIGLILIGAIKITKTIEPILDQIKESEQFNKQIILHANEGIIVYDKNMKYIVWNNFMEDFTGLKSNDVIGKHPLELFPFLKGTGVIQAIENALKGISSLEIDLPFTMPVSGISGWASDKTSPLYNSKNEIIGVITFVRDITERKKVEEELIGLNRNFLIFLENTEDFVYFKDEKSRLVFCSQALAKLVGYVSWRELIGKHDSEIFPEETANIYIEEEIPIFNEGKTLINKIDKFYYENGKVGWVNTSKFPILNDAGKVIGMFGLSRDITESQNTEEAIKETNLKLEEAIKEKDKFFSIIAHDLKSPFSGFLGLTKLMAESAETLTLNEINEISIAMQNSAKSLYSLLENLLEWSRMQRGMISFTPEKVMLKYLVDQNFEILKNSASQKNIKLVENLPHNYEVIADISMLNTVLRNLISNSIKFTEMGGTIEVGIKEDAQTKSKAIYIKDNGIGMDDDIKSKLFKIDQNVSRPGTEGESSTGLGLLICKEFIVKHSGKIWVESEEGRGSTFYFTLG
ncbi:MAG: PAS domain-containing sensor histidine kinase [Candidatus Kapabacteria bacterium]|nr:PAS domain-containing sensor histidine kinase [Candidatus Kapabacteria bacterium]